MAASDEDSFRAVTSAEERGERIAIEQEIDELRRFKALASGIRENAKGNSLLTALARAFAELERLGAAKTALIFTESKRTQTYLLELLADTPYGDGIVLFKDRQSVEKGKSVSVRVDLGGRRLIKK